MSAEHQNSAQARARVALAVSLAIAGSALAGAAFAQAPEADDEIIEVIVTGTRIVSPNMTSTSPVQVVTAEEIRQGGRADVTDVLNMMPQFTSNSGSQDLGNRTAGLSSAGGVATANLRGLGPNRTLVLVNGRRLGAGSPNTAISAPAPDLDQIPSALIERVDVVTGGASATYGSDAIAGVVNFITKRDFEGVQVDAQVGWNWHHQKNEYVQQLVRDVGFEPPTGTVNDGRNMNLAVTMGSSIADGAGNITVFFGYLEQEPVVSSERDFGACQLFSNAALTDLECGGSANSNYFVAPDDTEYQVAGNQFVPWGTVDTTVPPPIYNSQELISMIRENRRYNAGFMAEVDINDNVTPYGEFMFMNDRSRTTIAPSGLFYGGNTLTDTGGYLVNCSNPLLSAQQRALICTPAQVLADAANPGANPANSADIGIGRRNVEGGGRASYYEHTNYRAVLGLKGKIADGWRYDAYGQYYYTNFNTANENYLNFQSIANALQVTGTAANPVCISGGSCVPYNIFTEGAVTPEQLDYLYAPGTATGNTTLRTVHADVTGDLGIYGVQLPWTEEGVAVNVGYEHRNEALEFAPDAAQLGGLLSGAGGAAAAIDRSYSVQEVFGEVRVPIIMDRPGIRELVFDAGYRYSDYSVSGGANTWKAELQYAPTPSLRFRGGYQRAIRAPSLVELYVPENVGQIQIGTDPCAPTRDANNNLVPAAATLAQCALSGVTPQQYGNGGTTNTIPQGTAGQLTQMQGGNPNLEPETANTYTIGLTFTPEFLPGFTGSVDYFNIEVEDQITTYAAGTILQGCIFGGNPFYCTQLVRAPSNGTLNGPSVASGGYIRQTNVNIGAAKVEGVDVQAAYRFDIGDWGSLLFALNGAYQITNDTTPQPDLPTYDCAGLFGATCLTAWPQWRHNFSTTWRTPWNVNVTATWRHFSGVSLDNNDPDPTLNGFPYGARNEISGDIPAYNWLDLVASWAPLENLTFRAGINNALDKDPPILDSDLVQGGGANTIDLYDPFGRQLFFGVSWRL